MLLLDAPTGNHEAFSSFGGVPAFSVSGPSVSEAPMPPFPPSAEFLGQAPAVDIISRRQRIADGFQAGVDRVRSVVEPIRVAAGIVTQVATQIEAEAHTQRSKGSEPIRPILPEAAKEWPVDPGIVIDVGHVALGTIRAFGDVRSRRREGNTDLSEVAGTSHIARGLRGLSATHQAKQDQ